MSDDLPAKLRSRGNRIDTFPNDVELMRQAADRIAKLEAVAEAARSLLTNSAWSVPSKELVDLQASLAALDAGDNP